MRFVNRRRELTLLSKLYAEPRAQLVVISGRSGLGKTALVREWLKTRRYSALYWTAAPGIAAEQLRSFSQELRQHVQPGAPDEPGFTYPDWKAALRAIGQMAEHERPIVVLDGFDHLLAADRGVASDVKVTWDLELEQGPVFLVLVTSDLLRLRQDVLSYQAPLYGRLTDHLRLRPFSFGDLAHIVPDYPAADRLALLAVTGGLPGYLEKVDPHQPLDANLRRLLVDADFQSKVDQLLRQPSIQRPTEYRAVLRGLVRGPASVAVLARRTGLSERKVWWRLTDLEILRLAAVRNPVAGPYQIAARGGRARIIDFQAGFHVQFVAPHLAALRRGDDRPAWQAIRRGLNRYVAATVFRELCWEWLGREWSTGRLKLGGAAGPYWAPGRPDIEFMIINEDRRQVVIGTSLWSNQPMGPERVVDLVRRSRRVVPAPNSDWSFTYVFFSRQGFTTAAIKTGGELNCLWVDLDQLGQTLR